MNIVFRDTLGNFVLVFLNNIQYISIYNPSMTSICTLIDLACANTNYMQNIGSTFLLGISLNI